MDEDNNSAISEKFEDVMRMVGYGRFQARYYLFFNLFYSTLIIAAYFSILLSLAIPEHWCYVPKPPDFNHTEIEWKMITIPRKSNTSNAEFEECVANDVDYFNYTQNDTFKQGNININHSISVACQYGWTYDKTWFTSTISSEENWVCDKEIYSSNVQFLSALGDVIGSVCMGYIGDRYGRRFVLILSITLLFLGRVSPIFFTGIFPLYAALITLGSSASMASMQTPLTIALEISDSSARARAAFLNSCAFATAFTLLAALYWILGDWWRFSFATSLPLMVIIFFKDYLIESPRWLASRGRIDECIEVLKHISKVNGTKFPEEVKGLLEKCQEKSCVDNKNKKNESLLSSKTLILTTIFIAIGRSAHMLMMEILLYNVSNIGGNPFLTYMIQSVILIPAYLLGQYLSNRIGRRLTRLLTGILVTSLYSSVIFTINETGAVVTGLSACAMFWLGVHDLAIGLHMMEIFPTTLRQTGVSFAMFSANMVTLSTPYIIYMGRTIDERAPYMIATVAGVLATISAVISRETLHQPLPETAANITSLRGEMKLFKIRTPR